VFVFCNGLYCFRHTAVGEKLRIFRIQPVLHLAPTQSEFRHDIMVQEILERTELVAGDENL